MVKPPFTPSANFTALPRAPLSLIQNPVAWLKAFWRFSRPHTIIGTSLSVLGLFAVAWAAQYPIGSWPGTLPVWQAIAALLLTWLACLCGNVYIVGLNQVEDVEIDRINKPHLPIAAGDFSRSQAVFLVAIAGTSAVGLALLSQSLYLLATIWISLAIGTAYSLPPIRLKRFPLWASICILSVRGAVVNLGIFLHARSQLGQQPTVPARVWVLTLFILIFSFVIAIFKDIPDIEGDRRYNITTFSVQLGQTAVFNLARWVLTGCYLGLIVAAVFLPEVNRPVLILSHAAGIAYFWYLSRRVAIKPAASEAGLSYPAFYQFIWKLFFVEYLIFPAACLLA
ncbi:MAG: homogentisate phytyltransferase [Leptolyngbya sp. SIO4C1]|nr:homogentisate phytyltransferase [Leptolyngbya sp. SIO4C1]